GDGRLGEVALAPVQLQEDLVLPGHVALDAAEAEAALECDLVHPVGAEQRLDVVPDREVVALGGEHEHGDRVVGRGAPVGGVELVEEVDVLQVALLGPGERRAGDPGDGHVAGHAATEVYRLGRGVVGPRRSSLRTVVGTALVGCGRGVVLGGGARRARSRGGRRRRGQAAGVVLVPVARARRRSATSVRPISMRPCTRGLSSSVPSKSPADAKIATGTVNAWKKANRGRRAWSRTSAWWSPPPVAARRTGLLASAYC